MALELGLQVYSVREALKKDFWSTMEAVAKIGYKHIELANHSADKDVGTGFGIPAAELKKRLDALGLDVVSSHVSPLDKVDVPRLIEYAHAIGNKNIACPMRFFATHEDVLAFADEMNALGQKLHKEGIQLYYHNHFQEFQKLGGAVVLETLLGRTDPRFLKVEFDTFWALRGGIDPVAYLKKLGTRCELIHQKDLARSANPVNLWERIKADARIDMDGFHNDGARDSDFTEAGEGVMDIKGIIAEARRIGAAKYLFIEQDRTSRDELESVAISYRNAKRLLA
jgi:sugar phosphate isomerase/epimerase